MTFYSLHSSDHAHSTITHYSKVFHRPILHKNLIFANDLFSDYLVITAVHVCVSKQCQHFTALKKKAATR